MRLNRDGWTGLAVLAASLFLFALTLGLKDNPMVPIGPGFYPRIVLGITAVLAAMLFVFSIRTGNEKKSEEDNNYSLVFIVFLIFGVYAGALPFLGFRLATLLFVVALQATLEPPKGARAWALVAVTAVVTTFASYFVFEKYLSVLLPRGRWTGF